MDQELNDKLAAVLAKYSKEVPQDIEFIDNMWNKLLNQPEENLHQELYIKIHALHGAAGMFGYNDIANVTQQMQSIMRQKKTLTDDEKEQMKILIAQLKALTPK